MYARLSDRDMKLRTFAEASWKAGHVIGYAYGDVAMNCGGASIHPKGSARAGREAAATK